MEGTITKSSISLSSLFWTLEVIVVVVSGEGFL